MLLRVILILWSILYKILDQFGYKPYDPYATLMMCGTVLCGTLGITAVPFHGNTLVILTAYASISGSMVDFLQYMSFSIPIGLLLIMVYTLICRFIFHPDVSLIKNIDVSIFEQNKPKLEKKQKIVAALLILFVVLLMTPSVLPKTWLLTKFISGLGLFGAAAVVVLLALAIRIKGKSLMDFKEMAQNGMVWDIFFLSALALPMSSALTAEGTGVKEFIILIMQPLLSGKSGMLFIGIVMILAALLTNVANNTVLALIIVPIIYSFASEVGVDSAAAVALLVLCTHMAIITPAASPMAGMLFANTAWVKAKDVYKYMSVILAAFIVIAISAGYFWLNIVF